MQDCIKVPESVRSGLRRPFGKVYCSLEEVKSLSRTHKVVSVGDLSTLVLLSFGIRPHLAVFDFCYSRKKLEKERVDILRHAFKGMHRYTNKKGTLSLNLMKDAPMLLKKGGAVKIDGEEDMTALLFIRSAGASTIIVYGQPGEGIVVVKPDKKTKLKVEKIMGKIMKNRYKNKKKNKKYVHTSRISGRKS